jgi:DtxR family Mn-dependent transcriptional regulator
MTPNKEDYIKAIYHLGGADGLVGTKQIADALNISLASVSEMLGKLGRDGLLEYEAYKGSKLTEKGLQMALALIRGHRLWEVFLIRHLDYSWREAHEDAELLEHISPQRLTSRLDKFLNFPAYCPHGSAIPNSDGQMNKSSLQSLDQLSVGESSNIRMVVEDNELMDYLQGLGIEIGSSVTVIEIGAYEGPFTLALKDRQIQLSHKAACQIYVDQVTQS